MSSHVMPDPGPDAWVDTDTGQYTVTASGTYRRVPRLVPEGVLLFGPDGTAEGLRPDPTIDVAALVANSVVVWARDVVDDIVAGLDPLGDPVWEPESSHCSYWWMAAGKWRLPYVCTEAPHEVGDHVATGLSAVQRTLQHTPSGVRKAA